MPSATTTAPLYYIMIYYDFGGGCYSHARTYPQNQKYCFTHKPPILLSHWDFDHWAAAIREPKAKNLVWIVPRQLIGATHLKFAWELHKRGNLIIWPQEFDSLDIAFGSINKCTGESRNNSGLVLLLNLLKQDKNHKVLLPGDSAFEDIPVNILKNLNGLVASHHGGFVGNDQYPVSAGKGSIVFSFGLKNSYGHPDQRSIICYLLKGWSHQLSTHNGHAAIGWSGCSLPNLGCGGNLCDLSIKQV